MTIRTRRWLSMLLAVASSIGLCTVSAQEKSAAGELYKVVDGYKVDPNTMNGFRAWRAAACDRCHGANQEGLVGPSLLESMKSMTKAEFVKTIKEGRLEKGMPNFETSQTVLDNMDGLYAYLKGRANGDITRARVQELSQ